MVGQISINASKILEPTRLESNLCRYLLRIQAKDHEQFKLNLVDSYKYRSLYFCKRLKVSLRYFVSVKRYPYQNSYYSNYNTIRQRICWLTLSVYLLSLTFECIWYTCFWFCWSFFDNLWSNKQVHQPYSFLFSQTLLKH